MKLQGVSSVVTGGGKGIGRAITLALAREGANVAIIANRDLRNAEKVAKKIRQSGSHSIALLADITKKDSVENIVQCVVAEFGKIDLLVNNAGMGIKGPLLNVSVEDWDKVINVNLKGVFLCSVSVAKEMTKLDKGNIINIAGAAAHRCYPENGAYGPSKAAVINLTRQMALEWAKYNIRVNAVSPGPTMTTETKKIIADKEVKRRIAKIPMSRLAEPDEVASVVLFLASEDSRYMTGQSLIVDGGGVHTWYLYP